MKQLKLGQLSKSEWQGLSACPSFISVSVAVSNAISFRFCASLSGLAAFPFSSFLLPLFTAPPPPLLIPTKVRPTLDSALHFPLANFPNRSSECVIMLLLLLLPLLLATIVVVVVICLFAQLKNDKINKLYNKQELWQLKWPRNWSFVAAAAACCCCFCCCCCCVQHIGRPNGNCCCLTGQAVSGMAAGRGGSQLNMTSNGHIHKSKPHFQYLADKTVLKMLKEKMHKRPKLPLLSASYFSYHSVFCVFFFFFL